MVATTAPGTVATGQVGDVTGDAATIAAMIMIAQGMPGGKAEGEGEAELVPPVLRGVADGVTIWGGVDASVKPLLLFDYPDLFPPLSCITSLEYR